ncbi:hypothetical protein CRG98_008689 [Punica granatum]|uniref:DUF7745 domain-containing protein n=1 Tax=Punica granatum TaxID=22663 RepID=A0A2I0KSY7_PUNGR|nr:hypothetical protein CRG98_008689 [Punica granatum]
MDRPAPSLRLEAITPPRQEIMRIWRTFRLVDHAFIQGIIRDMVMFTETPVDWIFLRTAIEFLDPEHAVFNFQGTELAPTIEEYTTLIQRPTPTTQGIFVPNPFAVIRSQLSNLLGIPTQDVHQELHQGWDHGIRIAWLSDWTLLHALTPSTASYQCDVCHGFLLLIFGTLLFPYSPNLVDGAIAQVVFQAVGGHSYVEALLAKTVRSLDYVREVIPHPEHSFSEWRHFWRELTPVRFLWVARWSPGGPMITGCLGIVGVPLLSHLESTLIFPGRVIRQLGGLQDIPAEADRLPYRIHKSQLASHRYPTRQRLRMAEEDRVDISEEVNPPVPAHSQPPPTHAPPPPTPAGVLPAYSGAPPTHLPPSTSSGVPPPRVSLTSSASHDQARIMALEGMVNQLAASMTANMAELFALLRGPNRPSSSSTPPPRQGLTVDLTPWVPLTQIPENIDAPAPPTLHTSTAHPFTSPFPPPSAPTAVPLPPTTFLSSEQAPSAPPLVSIPAPAAIYTVPPPMVFSAPSAPAPTHPQAAELPSYPPLQPHTNFPYQAPPPINTTFHEPGTPTHAAQFASPTHVFAEADTEQERRLKRMEETIRALQASDTRPDARYGDCSLFPGMRLPTMVKIPEFRIYKGTTDPRHHLRHY